MKSPAVALTVNKPVMEMVSIGKLKEWVKNPRKKHAVGAIAGSIQQFGYLSPIIVQKGTYRILAGHGRLKALRERGAQEIPVIVADVTDQQADAYTIADNKLTDMSEFDLGDLGDIFRTMDADLAKATGFTDGELNAILKPERGEEPVEGDAVNTTMFVTFGTRDQLRRVKAEIKKLQSGNEKTIGQVIFDRFCPKLD